MKVDRRISVKEYRRGKRRRILLAEVPFAPVWQFRVTRNGVSDRQPRFGRVRLGVGPAEFAMRPQASQRKRISLVMARSWV
jgi:hypothetical protein